MKAKNTLYGILHWAMVEIRLEAVDIKNNKIFAISHTFHNFPLRLSEAKTEADYEALLAEVEDMTKDNEGLTSIVNFMKRRHGGDEQPESDL